MIRPLGTVLLTAGATLVGAGLAVDQHLSIAAGAGLIILALIGQLLRRRAPPD